MNFSDFHIDFVSPILKKNRCNGGNEVVNQFPELLEIDSHNKCVITRNIINTIMINFEKLLGRQLKLTNTNSTQSRAEMGILTADSDSLPDLLSDLQPIFIRPQI